MRYAFFMVAGIFFTAMSAHAGLEDVTYPIAELGNCESQEACFAYCDVSEHYDACMTFAQDKELLSQEEIQEYREVQEIVAQGAGPGGCATESECESYCGDLSHIDECLSFAQEHGLMSEEELQEAQQVKAALDAGYTLPGGCTDEENCESYCSDGAHMEECIAFGKAAGFISEEEAAEAEKFLTIMRSGGSPGGCQNQEECEAYCADGENADECLNFGVEAGFMTQEEADTAREMGMQPGEEFVGPGGCTDEESCHAYCEQESNQEECQAFFGGATQEEEYKPSQEYPSQEYSEHENESEEGQYPEAYEYEESGESTTPDYQYEGGQNYDIYEHGEESFYGQNEFESLDLGDESLDFDQEAEDGGSYEEIYIEPYSDDRDPTSYDEPSHDEQPNYNEPPSFSEPSTTGDTEAPPIDSDAGESHSTANAGFVSSAKQLLGKVLQLLQI